MSCAVSGADFPVFPGEGSLRGQFRERAANGPFASPRDGPFVSASQLRSCCVLLELRECQSGAVLLGAGILR